MSIEDAFLSLLKKAQGAHAVRTVGIGRATDITDQHCTVVRDGAPDLFDVRLHAVADQLESTITVYPVQDSYVLYALIDNSTMDAVVISCSEIEKTVVKIGQAVHEISQEGHSIKKGADSVKTLISELITEVQKIIVINGTGPNVAALEQIKQKFNNIFF